MSSRPTPSYTVRSCPENKTRPNRLNHSGKYLPSQGKSLELWWAEAQENLNKPEDPFHTISVTSAFPLSPPRNSHSSILGEAGGLSSSLRSKLYFAKLVISGIDILHIGQEGHNSVTVAYHRTPNEARCAMHPCKFWGSEAGSLGDKASTDTLSQIKESNRYSTLAQQPQRRSQPTLCPEGTNRF